MDIERAERPRQNIEAITSDMARAWAAVAGEAATIAHAKRTLFLAYVAEDFTEPQALELVKSI